MEGCYTVEENINFEKFLSVVANNLSKLFESKASRWLDREYFNSLPKSLRQIKRNSSVDFKEELDLFLAKLPDQPHIGDQVPHICDQLTAKPSNSLVDVMAHKNAYGGG